MTSNHSGIEETREIIREVKELFSHGPFLMRTIQYLRPYICPFHLLLPLVPKGASVLDIGCGSGVFLGLLARREIRQGVGFDASAPAIELATIMRNNLPSEWMKNISFELLNTKQAWPQGVFDTVTMIDVMHHIPPSAQREVFLSAVDHVAPGGTFLYKDMAKKPAILALANRLHDLVMARQWIHYVPLLQIKAWGKEAGLHIQQESKFRMLWYAHEWVLFKKQPD